jgi:hypothetical protein
MKQTTPWQAESDATPSPRDVAFMASTLEGRHGQYAAEIAEFFASFHDERGDAGRCWAWVGVAATVRGRQRARTTKS